ncbi:MAG: hypothetical protein JWM11_1215 [Planctomycetaceae bacterium]|nr:hypothetical protein [Planctomycetaceae bacterium]
MADEKSKAIRFSDGEFLAASEGGEIVRSSPTSVVVVAGMARSGKTTLVGELYGLFHKGPFAGHIFAGSRTLPGFERRCHLARLCSEREVPDTERTGFGESHDLLHLRLAAPNGTRSDILFSDIYGEAFHIAADSADECRKITILKRANHVAILVDGKKAVDKPERQRAFAGPDSLLRQCLDSGMLDINSNVQIVLTKWDLVAGQGDAFINDKFEWLIERHCNRLATLTVHKTALRTNGPICAGLGMDELLQTWITVQSRYVIPPTVDNNLYHSEFDRLDATWQVALNRRYHD